MNTYLFDISRGSLHDGPGMRTMVFVKGCPLRCRWCHNPESQKFTPQLSCNSRSCIGCGACAAVCPAQAHRMEDGLHRWEPALCRQCGQCAAVCPAMALKMYGYSKSPREVFELVRRDSVFFAQSGGGITISGGEPLSHPEFCRELLALCRAEGIHTCVETSGMGDTQVLLQYARYTNLFLYDWKISDDADAATCIGSETGRIRENLRCLLEAGADVLLRCPVIPGVNDTEAHFTSIREWLAAYPALRAELLPYHNFGVGKSRNMGTEQQSFPVPTQEQKAEWLSFFEQSGVIGRVFLS